MLQQINKKIIFYISLVIILGTFNNKNLKNFDLPKINMVNIEGIKFNDNEYLKIMNLIKLNNLLSIQKSQIKEILNSNNLIEEYEVFKKYPSSLEIKIEKTNFLASTNINGKNYLVGSNGKFINTIGYSKNLPFVFGNNSYIFSKLRFNQCSLYSSYSFSISFILKRLPDLPFPRYLSNHSIGASDIIQHALRLGWRS